MKLKKLIQVREFNNNNSKYITTPVFVTDRTVFILKKGDFVIKLFGYKGSWKQWAASEKFEFGDSNRKEWTICEETTGAGIAVGKTYKEAKEKAIKLFEHASIITIMDFMERARIKGGEEEK